MDTGGGDMGKVFLAVAVLACMGSMAAAQAKLANDTVVWAEWSGGGWYHGKVKGVCSGGYQILFDDGDQSCCSPEQMALDVQPATAVLKAGIRVLAKWSDGKYYPGKISGTKGSLFNIAYDDGDTASVGASDIRIITATPVASGVVPAQSTAREPVSTTATVYKEIWKDGSPWAEYGINEGKIWINGSQIGEFSTSGKVWIDGSQDGEIEANGKIWYQGSRRGSIETNGRIWLSGSSIGEIQDTGEIWLDGSEWGEVDGGCKTHAEKRMAMYVIAFFAPEFGFTE